MRHDDYVEQLKKNRGKTIEYYKKSIKKTYQQIYLEKEILPKLIPNNFNPQLIADIACGAGTLTLHMINIYPDAQYMLLDLNNDAIELAKTLLKDKGNITFICEDFLETSIPENSCDLVFCMQTLSFVTDPERFIKKIVSITSKGGYFIISSLFNLEHDCDIYAKVKDHTLTGDGMLSYNTFCGKTIEDWIGNYVEFYTIEPFFMPEDLPKSQSGLGSYTVMTQDGYRLTISGGLLLNWGFLYGKK